MAWVRAAPCIGPDIRSKYIQLRERLRELLEASSIGRATVFGTAGSGFESRASSHKNRLVRGNSCTSVSETDDIYARKTIKR